MRIRIEIDTTGDDPQGTLGSLARKIDRSTTRLADAVAANGGVPVPPQLLQVPEESRMANPVIQQLIDAVTRNKTVVDSAVTLIQGIADRVSAAVTTALANGATAEELAPLTDLVTDLRAEDDALAKAVTDNTPATP